MMFGKNKLTGFVSNGLNVFGIKPIVQKCSQRHCSIS